MVDIKRVGGGCEKECDGYKKRRGNILTECMDISSFDVGSRDARARTGDLCNVTAAL